MVVLFEVVTEMGMKPKKTISHCYYYYLNINRKLISITLRRFSICHDCNISLYAVENEIHSIFHLVSCRAEHD